VGFLEFELQPKLEPDGLRNLVLARMRADFPGIEFWVGRSWDRPITTIYFGGRSGNRLGLAILDRGDMDQADSAIVFTDICSDYADVSTDRELSQIIANTAAHELGHLLGLDHVGTWDDIMSEHTTLVLIRQDLSINWDDQYLMGTIQ
jgi:hypothetical protein